MRMGGEVAVERVLLPTWKFSLSYTAEPKIFLWIFPSELHNIETLTSDFRGSSGNVSLAVLFIPLEQLW